MPSGLPARLQQLRSLLLLLSGRYAGRYPGRLALLVGSVSLGVVAITASGNLVETALRSVESAWDLGRGLADLRVSNGYAGVPERLIDDLRGIPGVRFAAGVLRSRARIRDDLPDKELSVLAVDLLGDDPIHRAVLDLHEVQLEDEAAFLARPGVVLLDQAFAETHGLRPGGSLVVDLPTGSRELYIAGLLPPRMKRSLMPGPVAIMDLPAAQQILGRAGLVDWIDLELDPDADPQLVEMRLSQFLAGTALVTDAHTSPPELGSLLSSVRLILGIPAWMAMVIGILVIYHVAFLVVSQRKPALEVVRSLGASHRSLLIVLCTEALAIGAIGSLSGLALGVLVARGAAGIVGQTISAIYQPVPVDPLEFSRPFALVGAALGVSVTFMAFLGPARSALLQTPNLLVATPRRERWVAARRSTRVGLLLLILGAVLLLLQRSGVQGEELAAIAALSYAMILFGVGLQVPLLVSLLPAASRRIGGPGRATAQLGALSLAADPGRTGALVTAVLMGAAFVVMTVGSVSSLRENITAWIDHSQTADLIVAGAGSIGLLPSGMPMPSDFVDFLRRLPEVEAAEGLRVLPEPYADRWVAVASREPALFGTRYPVNLRSGDLPKARAMMARGTGAIVSTPFANRNRRAVGDTVALRSPSGLVSFEIAAVIDDFNGADLGTIFIAPQVFKQHWEDPFATAFHVWLRPGVSAERGRTAVSQSLDGRCDCAVLTSSAFRQKVAGVVDSLFYMAYALELVAAGVLVVAVSTFFAVAIGERRRELALLRVVGATAVQLRRSLLWEATAVGVAGSALGSAAGASLAYALVRRTMRVAAGFDFDFHLPAASLATVTMGALLVCIGSAFTTARVQLTRRGAHDAADGSQE